MNARTVRRRRHWRALPGVAGRLLAHGTCFALGVRELGVDLLVDALEPGLRGRRTRPACHLLMKLLNSSWLALPAAVTGVVVVFGFP